MTSPAAMSLSKKGGRSRDNSNSEAAGRLANWQGPDSLVYSVGGSESPDVEAMRADPNLDDMQSSLETASLKDEKDAKLVGVCGFHRLYLLFGMQVYVTIIERNSQ